MNRSLRSRVERLEQLPTSHWTSRLAFVDYADLEDYADESTWEEIYFEGTIAVVRHRQTGEIRGHYLDRRTDAELIEAGGNLAFL